MIYILGYVIASYVLTFLLMKYCFEPPLDTDQKEAAIGAFIFSPISFVVLLIVVICNFCSYISDNFCKLVWGKKYDS